MYTFHLPCIHLCALLLHVVCCDTMVSLCSKLSASRVQFIAEKVCCDVAKLYRQQFFSFCSQCVSLNPRSRKTVESGNIAKQLSGLYNCFKESPDDVMFSSKIDIVFMCI